MPWSLTRVESASGENERAVGGRGVVTDVGFRAKGRLATCSLAPSPSRLDVRTGGGDMHNASEVGVAPASCVRSGAVSERRV